MINDRIEKLILTNLIYREPYTRKVIAYLKEEYFEDAREKKIFSHIEDFIRSYNTLPTREAILIQLSEDPSLSQNLYSEISDYIDEIDYDEDKPVDEAWLLDCTETWCQDRALYAALSRSVQSLDANNSAKISKGDIPKLLTDALAVSFDAQIGHDYTIDSNERYEFYTARERKVPTHLEYFNKITDGGWSTQTLNLVMSGTGGGKTLFMTDMAANNLLDGQRVLYITLEMSEKRIAERIDANLMNVPVKDIKHLPRSVFLKKMEDVKDRCHGKLIIKQYPTASANVNHFRHLLNELRIKRGFVPTIIYLDYLNIASSCRVKMGAGLYEYAKAIAEEVRGLAVEFDVPIVSATQVGRAGYKSSDVELTNVSESWGVPGTIDFMVALINTDELTEQNKILVKQLKNRYGDESWHSKFVVGIDKAKQRLYDVEDSVQKEFLETNKEDKKTKDKDEKDVPAFDNSRFGQGMKAERSGTRMRALGKKKYEGVEI